MKRDKGWLFAQESDETLIPTQLMRVGSLSVYPAFGENEKLGGTDVTKQAILDKVKEKFDDYDLSYVPKSREVIQTRN